MGKLFREFTEEKLREVREHPYFAELRRETLEKAEGFMCTEPPIIKFSKIHEYVLTGNRSHFEADYSNYQDRLCTYFVAYLITEDEKYITPLSDIIWNICDLESWSIPAHVKEHLGIERRRQNLDLCSCVVAYQIAEILYFIGDKLPELVARRARAEIRYRTIESYKKYTVKDFWWYEGTNNWSAVCVAGILSAFLYVAEPEEIEEQLPKMLKATDCYLSGFKDDGACTEGYGYWNYGFAYFCLFASMLRDYTDGRINYFENEKVHKIALFQQNILLNPRESLSFSDADVEFMPYKWLSHFLKSVYPDMRLPAFSGDSRTSKEDGRPLRFIFWQDPELEDTEPELVNHYFENAEWYLYHADTYSLGAKAGNNAEFHNHNDVGAFSISKNGRVTFSDPGKGQYTAQYFSKERYELFITSARAHSVPIINGEYQKEGEREGGVITVRDGRFTFYMQGGYDIATLKTIVRDFDARPTELILTDTFAFLETPTSLTERFVAIQPIKLGKGTITSGDSVMHFDPDIFDVTDGFEDVTRPGGRVDRIYFADLQAKQLDKDMTLKFKFT